MNYEEELKAKNELIDGLKNMLEQTDELFECPKNEVGGHDDMIRGRL
jgi:hypothetical protein